MKLELMLCRISAPNVVGFCLARRKVDVGKWTKSRFACQSWNYAWQEMLTPAIDQLHAGSEAIRNPWRKKFRSGITDPGYNWLG